MGEALLFEYLQAPLQPLADNLESQTYEVILFSESVSNTQGPACPIAVPRLHMAILCCQYIGSVCSSFLGYSWSRGSMWPKGDNHTPECAEAMAHDCSRG